MSRSISPILSFARGIWSAKAGATAVLATLVMPMMVGFAGLAVDVGHLLKVRSELQASTDAAALAGAHDIYAGTAIATAQTYGAVAGGKNTIGNLTTTMVSGYPQLKCLSSTGAPCNGPSAANAIQVKQQTAVPMWFAKIVGVGSLQATATATAAAVGGQPQPLDVMIVLDTTASMNNADAHCSIPGATRLACALAGARTLLSSFTPSADSVGLMVFPGLRNASQAQYNYDCSASTTPQIVSYRNSPVYQVLGLTDDFKAEDDDTSLDTSSNLVRAFKGGAPGCTAGLSAVGGYGTFYGDAITAAQNALVATGRPNVQKVIIFLSDGDANASSGNMPIGRASNQCRQAITAAGTAAAAGTWVYSIAYGASTSATGSCSTDSPRISACSTMRQIASDPRFFFADNAGGTNSCTSAANSVSNLGAIFQDLAVTFQMPRLIPDSTI